ncbi:MAG: hypothetical protein KGR25_12035, partial [Chloroflexi bacterium]|nr:hypothetical protein [Chloroflexota bacterium]
MHKQRVAIFGFKDSLVGQIREFLRDCDHLTLVGFIASKSVPAIDEEDEHARRPNRKTEFVRDGHLYGLPVIAGPDASSALADLGATAALILEDDSFTRRALVGILAALDIPVVTLVHPSVFLGGSNEIGAGTVIFPNCHIGYKSDIGVSTIIQSACVIEHHNVVGSFCNINPRLTTGGFTRIGDEVEVNMSVDII